MNKNSTFWKRFKRFRSMKRAWWSLILMLVIYLTSLGASMLCNDKCLLEICGITILPLVQNSPHAIVSEAEITPYLRTIQHNYKKQKVAGIVINEDLTILETENANVLNISDKLTGHKITNFWPDFPQEILISRWHGIADAKRQVTVKGNGSIADATFILPPTGRRDVPRHTIRLRLWALDSDNKPIQETISFTEEETARYPFRPIPGHWLGIDDAGRDVFARLLYGLRVALNFGIILVICSMILGTAFGMIQGYFAGWLDLAGQRFTEIWSAMPFLYVMILLGALYGTSFSLLLICYAAFNWIGISYYMRGEMLRLRKTAFVEAAKCIGLPTWKIIIRHVLPNALVPLITFFPFSLVGAIGALAALDYLGFGLPSPTPSIGQLLQQAQVHRDAWWLILYPSLALFIIMLLSVFIGEGIRNAFDPRRQNRLQ